jgi:hypothetical protein
MRRSAVSAQARLVRLQLAVVAVAAALLHLTPPAQGTALLVPLAPASHGSLARLAVDAGASLVATGPVSGSIVVRYERSGFPARMASVGVLPLSATALGCGGPEART